MITDNGCRKTDLYQRRSLTLVSLVSQLIPWIRLTKLPVCLLVAFSALFGFVLADPGNFAGAMITTFGMLLLACGGASLNSLQEIRLDASMKRTRNRPLPSGRLTILQAAVCTTLLLTAGLAILFWGRPSPVAAGVGLVAIILYNLVYTKLKTKTAIAIVPGAISGALPPYIGWVAAGGAPLSVPALSLFVLFILWQVPHSLLILLHHRQDYLENDIPSLVKMLPEAALKRIFIVWIAAFSVVLLLVSGFYAGMSAGINILVWICTSVLFVGFCFCLSCQYKNNYYYLFIQLNCYLFFIMSVLIVGRLYSG